MTLSDVFEAKNRGIVVAGCDDALDALEPNQIRELIGPEIQIQSADGAKARYRVLDIQTTTSPFHKKNIFILLPSDANRADLQIGALIYSSAGFDDG